MVHTSYTHGQEMLDRWEDLRRALPFIGALVALALICFVAWLLTKPRGK